MLIFITTMIIAFVCIDCIDKNNKRSNEEYYQETE